MFFFVAKMSTKPHTKMFFVVKIFTKPNTKNNLGGNFHKNYSKNVFFVENINENRTKNWGGFPLSVIFPWGGMTPSPHAPPRIFSRLSTLLMLTRIVSDATEPAHKQIWGPLDCWEALNMYCRHTYMKIIA